MEQKDFTKRFAQQTRSTSAQAADNIDGVVNDLLRRLRAGEPAVIPGLGTLPAASQHPRQRTRAAKPGKESR